MNNLFYLSMNKIHQKYNGWLCFPNQVDLNTNILDNVPFKKVVVQPTENPRSIRPQKSKSKITTNKKKTRLKNHKFRSVSTQLYEGSTEPNSDGTNILHQHLFYTNRNPKNYPFIDICISIPIVTWKLTKNCSHIISDRLLSTYSLYSGNN